MADKEKEVDQEHYRQYRMLVLDEKKDEIVLRRGCAAAR
jgi:hypothetical protein